MYWRHGHHIDPHYSHNPYFELKWIVLALSPVIISRHLFSLHTVCVWFHHLCSDKSGLLSHVVYNSVATGQIFPIFQQECFCQPHHAYFWWQWPVVHRCFWEKSLSPQPLMWFMWLNNKAEWFNGLSVWSSRFCLHNAHFSLGPIINLFQFLLALPTFHWPHHTLFYFFYLSNICY